jgi:hypothetical protein
MVRCSRLAVGRNTGEVMITDGQPLRPADNLNAAVQPLVVAPA